VSARAPGLAGAALAAPGVAVQLIADGVHVSDDLLRVAFAAAAGRCSIVAASELPQRDRVVVSFPAVVAVAAGEIDGRVVA